MFVFGTVEKYFRLAGIFEFRLPDILKKLPINLIYSCFVSFLLFCQMSTISWFLIFDAKTFEDYGEPASILFGICPLFFSYWAFLAEKSSFIELMMNLRKMVNERSKSDLVSRLLYETTNERLNYWTNTFWTFSVGFCLAVYGLPNPAISYYNYYTGESLEGTFFLIVNSTWPYNWRSPIQYTATIILQYVSLIYYGTIFVSVLFFYIGVCIFSLTFINDLEYRLSNINDNIVKSNGHLAANERVEFKIQFYEIIRFHAEAKQLVINFSEVYKNIIAVCLMIISLFLCGSLLQIHIAISSGSYSTFYRYLDVTLIFIVWLFLFCHFGDEVTNRFIDVNDSIYKSAWYLYPIEIRKDIRFAMRIAQQPVFMQGFANIQCTRFIFQKIMNTSYSIYVMLRPSNI